MSQKIEQAISTTVIQTSRRGCVIEVSGSDRMFKICVGSHKRDDGTIQYGSEHWMYMDELDTLIENLITFKDKQFNSKVV